MLKDVLNGKKPDIALGVTTFCLSGQHGKKASLRAIEAAISDGTGLAIWRIH